MTTQEHILIVDDHPVVLDGIHLFLASIRSNAKFITATNGKGAIAAMQTNEKISWAFIDLNLPDIQGIELIKIFKNENFAGNIVVLSSEIEAKTIHQALLSGANGVLAKSFTKEEFEHCMSAIDVGEIFMTDTHAEELQYYRDSLLQEESFIDKELGARQLETLKLLSKGFSNKEISEQMEISLSTVKSHVYSLMIIFEATNRTQCVAKARGFNII